MSGVGAAPGSQGPYVLSVDRVSASSLAAGDANQDLSFDQRDIVLVLQAAKYLTGQPAAWGEGDWNGAPGGSAGSPPVGDGLFNQLDIVAALQNGLYLKGRYAATAGRSVPADDPHVNISFSSADVDRALSAGKYLSGEPATWHEGDWNGDGVFNELDIVDALVASRLP